MKLVTDLYSVFDFQSCRTPSRSEAGVELLAKYFNHLPLVESRFFSPTHHSSIFFTWYDLTSYLSDLLCEILALDNILLIFAFRYDSFTGVPVCQQNLSLEKASMLFNMAALYSQIATRSDRQTSAGLKEAISAFQKAAGMKIISTDHFQRSQLNRFTYFRYQIHWKH